MRACLALDLRRVCIHSGSDGAAPRSWCGFGGERTSDRSRVCVCVSETRDAEDSSGRPAHTPIAHYAPREASHPGLLGAFSLEITQMCFCVSGGVGVGWRDPG